MAFFSIRMEQITLVYNSEIFPLRLCVQGCRIGITVNQVVSGVLSMTFLLLYNAITLDRAVFFFVAIASITLMFFYTMMLEMKGWTLEEMGQSFGKSAK